MMIPRIKAPSYTELLPSKLPQIFKNNLENPSEDGMTSSKYSTLRIINKMIVDLTERT